MTWARKIVLLLGFVSFKFNRIAAQDLDQLIKEFNCKEEKKGRSVDSMDDTLSEIFADSDTPVPATRKIIFVPEFHPQLSSQSTARSMGFNGEENTRVFICDWSKIAKRVKYQQMAENLEKSATQWADRWNSTSHQATPFHHFIGAGLGAHFVGLVARKLQVKNLTVNRITGLDPVGICFDTASASKCGNKTISGLKKSDAKYVDVLFTGREFWGICDPPEAADKMEMCHACYFANGGYRQPGCEGNGDGPNILSACSHNRAVDLFVESIYDRSAFNSSGCTFGGQGPCNLIINNFGYFTDLDSEGIFGFATNVDSPYSIPLICWPEAGSDDGKSSYQDCHISDHYIT